MTQVGIYTLSASNITGCHVVWYIFAVLHLVLICIALTHYIVLLELVISLGAKTG